jgi:hypothetical protein
MAFPDEDIPDLDIEDLNLGVSGSGVNIVVTPAVNDQSSNKKYTSDTVSKGKPTSSYEVSM